MDTKLLMVMCMMACLAATNAMSVLDLIHHGEFGAFMLKHKKSYAVNSAEYMRRFKTFRENKQKVDHHNAQGASFQMALNQFADMPSEEFQAVYNGYNRTAPTQAERQSLRRNAVAFLPAANVATPETVDWRAQGAVTPVKDQGQCGSCWAFSTTGALEGQHFRKSGKLVSLSEQNLVDCSKEYSYGCNGGVVVSAFQYVRDNGGIDTENVYPYEGSDESCRFDANGVGATDKGYVEVSSGDEEQLMSAVTTVGPVSVAIDASHESFQFYSEGVYVEPQCKSDAEGLDHAVLVVGYGTENGQDYWLVKNSWGADWGDKGYIKMARNKENQCGVATEASYPLV